jgi:hypothetical protein
MGPFDMLIGAHAKSLNMLVTNNTKEFERIRERGYPAITGVGIEPPQGYPASQRAGSWVFDPPSNKK